MRLQGLFPLLLALLCGNVGILGNLFGIYPDDKPSGATIKVIKSNLKEGFF
jgi:hypothetical protein